jgi:hypothetical protein
LVDQEQASVVRPLVVELSEVRRILGQDGETTGTCRVEEVRIFGAQESEVAREHNLMTRLR